MVISEKETFEDVLNKIERIENNFINYISSVKHIDEQMKIIKNTQTSLRFKTKYLLAAQTIEINLLLDILKQNINKLRDLYIKLCKIEVNLIKSQSKVIAEFTELKIECKKTFLKRLESFKKEDYLLKSNKSNMIFIINKIKYLQSLH